MRAQDTVFYRKREFRAGTKTLDLSTPKVMGILNVTPDSFYDGGKFSGPESILAQAGKMLDEGASILDVGAASSRPGAKEIPESEEEQRLIPAIRLIREKYPDCILSADTYRSRIAEKAAAAGADIINDISGGEMDGDMLHFIASSGLPYILMHMKGSPGTMQVNPEYENVTDDIFSFFQNKIKWLEKSGAKNLVLDPGFGFGKTLEHNYQLLAGLRKFREFGYPVLAGFSRKSMIGKVLGVRPADALNGTTVLNTIALLNGADILRVHDVKEATEAVKLVGEYLMC